MRMVPHWGRRKVVDDDEEFEERMRRGDWLMEGTKRIKWSTGSFEALEDKDHSAELTNKVSCSCVRPNVPSCN